MAINEAIKFCIKNPGQNFLILSDSLSALTSLLKPKIDIRINNYILEAKSNYLEFIEINNEKFSLKFKWIPAHRGIPGNEEADRLAKSATEKVSELEYLVPFTDYREELKKRAICNTNVYIKEQGEKKGKFYFNSYFSNNKKPWFSSKKYSRHLIVWVNRARSNHYHLAASLARINIINDSMCPCNQYEEDLNHVIWQCERYEEQRKVMIKKLCKINFRPPFHIEQVLYELKNNVLLNKNLKS